MIITEIIDNGKRIRHYSDKFVRILQNETGVVYDDAVDVLPCKYTYTETDERIETAEDEAIEAETELSKEPEENAQVSE